VVAEQALEGRRELLLLRKWLARFARVARPWIHAFLGPWGFFADLRLPCAQSDQRACIYARLLAILPVSGMCLAKTGRWVCSSESGEIKGVRSALWPLSRVFVNAV
jgi:hypothetical protein